MGKLDLYNTGEFILDDDTFAVGESYNGLVDAAHDDKASVFYGDGPGKKIPAIELYARGREDRDPQRLHEQTDGRKAVQRIAFADACPFFGMISLMKRAI